MSAPIERAADALKSRYKADARTRRTDAKTVFKSIDRDELAQMLINHHKTSISGCLCGKEPSLGTMHQQHQADAVLAWLTGKEGQE